MNLYLETSALVKPYVGERDAYLVAAAVEVAELGYTSILTLPEATSAICAGERRGMLNAFQSKQARAAFLRDWPHLHRLRVDAATVQLASDFITRWPLRGFDAVHIATAHQLREVLGSRISFMTFDAQLRRAAVESGLQVLPD